MSSRKREPVELREQHDSEVPRESHPSGFRLKEGRHADAVPPRLSSRPPGRTRWTVVEEFVKGGFRYQLVRRPIGSEPPPKLTRREEQAVAYAQQGHSNKSIAFLLGLAPSTIGVLLYRAATKLGARSRTQLLAAYARLKKSLDEP